MPTSIACARPTPAISSSRRWIPTPPATRRRPRSTWSTLRAAPIRGWWPISTWCTNDPPGVRAVLCRAARADSALRRRHPEIARRLCRFLGGPQTRAAWGSPPTEPGRPGRRPRTARPPLPAPEKHRRDLVPGASRRPGGLPVPAGSQVIVMRMRLPLFLLCVALAFAQQAPPTQRDLKVEKLDSVPAGTARPVTIPTSYAVIVGISRYRNLADKEQLQFAERDAQSIFTALISPEGGNFRVENVHMLTGEKATLAAVRREIGTWLPSVAKEDDRVLIYFAGHGFMSQGKRYLAPFDFQRGRIAETGYPMDELGSAIGGKIKAKSKILLPAACHSGAITPENSTDRKSTR